MEENIKLIISFVILGYSLANGNPQTVIDITPNDASTSTFHKFVNVSDDINTVIVKSDSEILSGFYILQAHSHRFNVTLSYSGESRNVTGYNVGLNNTFQGPFEHFFLIEKLTNNDSIIIDSTILIAVVVYDDKAPIPGGCDSSNNDDPMIKISNSPDLITINAIAPSSNKHECNASSVKIEIYHYYLTTQDFSSSGYFKGILSMLDIEQVKLNGRLAATYVSPVNIEEYFSLYIKTGEVFTILAYDNGFATAYVPSVSYGDDINNLIATEEEGAKPSTLFVVLWSILPIIAIVIIYAGHTLFHFTTFFLGFSCGTIISFFLFSSDGARTVDYTLLISLLLGLLYGFLWLGIWFKLGIPLLSASLTFLHAAILFTSIIYHCGVGDDPTFHHNSFYWTLFGGIVFMCWFILSMFTMHGHILSCSFLGSYILMITTLNYWLGGNLQYIIINVYRRIFVANFNVAVLQPPFQMQDHVIVVIGVLFLLHGLRRQVKLQRGKPPFPPHQSFRGVGERSPLLGHF